MSQSLYIGFSTLAITVFIPGDKEMRYWPLAGKLAFAYGAALIFLCLDSAHRLHLCRCEAARHALCDVDVARGFDPGRHRNHHLFYFARSASTAMPGMLGIGEVGIRFLPVLRDGDEAAGAPTAATRWSTAGRTVRNAVQSFRRCLLLPAGRRVCDE